MRGFGARDHVATVVRTSMVTPHMVRIRMSAPTLFENVTVGPTAWLRFWFPDPTGSDREHQRAYTLVSCEPETGEFAVDVVLHEPAGPATVWAGKAEPGDEVQVMSFGSSRFAVPDEPPAGYLLVGDPASVPAINGIVAALPDDAEIALYLERQHEEDELIPLASHPGLRVRWVPRDGETSLAAAIDERDWSNWYAWAATEAGSLKHLRKTLRDRFGFPKADTYAQAYWTYGRAMGSLRRTGEEKATEQAPAEREVTASAVRPAEEKAAGREAAVRPAEKEDAGPTSAVRSDEQEAAGQRPDGREAVRSGGVASAVRDVRTGQRLAGQASAVRPDEQEGAGSASGVKPGGAVSAARAARERQGRWRSQAAKELLAPVKTAMIVAGVVQGVVTLVQLAPFVLLAELARLLLAGADGDRLRGTAVAFLVVFGAGALLGSALMVWLHVLDARFGARVRHRLLGKLVRLPLGWFTRRGSGAVKKLVQDDTLELHGLVTHAVPDGVAAVVAPVAVLVYLFATDWRLALVLFVPIIVYLFAFAAMMFQSGPKIAEASRWAERMGNESAAFFAGQPVIRMFGGVAASSFRRELESYIGFLDGWQRPFIGKKTFIDLVTRPMTFLWLIMVVGTPMVVSGAMEAATLLPFLLLGTTFGARLLGIGLGMGGVRAGVLAARRIAVVLGEKELTTRPETVEPEGERGVVRFERVSFGYRPGKPVIHDVSLALRPGTVTALVGPSGSGKSTLAGLLARFHDVDSGAVTVGGRDIRAMSGDELYTRVGFVFQDAQLVHGTVRENIALARPEATTAEIETAARDARIHERILRLPDGYETVLDGDGGLSGGERQRLTIARALLADTPVLVLDEATAFADPESEHLVQQALTRLTRGRTVLVVAHRLHTVVDADRIVVLDHGRVAETGTHTELIASGGRYRRLWDSRGSVPAKAEVSR
ncbi:ATP-binding cassette domain-containing protein [Streptosporangium sp. NPDC001559]|uniref:ATP-binding cassette domain-containing protein n=1 Tax=Streptosporangium sp. NPDC001559 TaxID=3366187 RepID=UPI0036F13FF9